MRINWGTKLIIVYSVFVTATLFMVYLCSKQKTELVAEDYYAKELKYQDVINSADNAKASGIEIGLQQDAANIYLLMPKEVTVTNGSIEFYRPSDATRDMTIALQPDADGRQAISRQRFIKGVYTVKVNWQTDGKQLYAEKQLFVN